MTICLQILTQTRGHPQVKIHFIKEQQNSDFRKCSMFYVPDVIAWFDEMQAIVTVWQGILSEKPALSAAYSDKIKNKYRSCNEAIEMHVWRLSMALKKLWFGEIMSMLSTNNLVHGWHASVELWMHLRTCYALKKLSLSMVLCDPYTSLVLYSNLLHARSYNRLTMNQ